MQKVLGLSLAVKLSPYVEHIFGIICTWRDKSHMSARGTRKRRPLTLIHKAQIRGGGKIVRVVFKYLFRSLLVERGAGRRSNASPLHAHPIISQLICSQIHSPLLGDKVD